MEIANKELQERSGRHHEVQEVPNQVNEVKKVGSRSYNVPDEINEEDLQAELDALSAFDTETSYLDDVVLQPVHRDLGLLQQNGLKSKQNPSEPAGMVVTTGS